jgi:glyoxylase-like metal-dependent hydrolase (beta-lactamase superfamily II)
MLSDPNKGEATNRSVMPLEKQGVIDLMDGETELAPGTTAFPTPGHTAGHMSLFIASNNERALLVGGILGSPMQATETDLHYWPDWDGPMGIKTIKDILDRAGREDSVVIRSHLSYPGWGTMIRWEGRRYWKDL